MRFGVVHDLAGDGVWEKGAGGWARWVGGVGLGDW